MSERSAPESETPVELLRSLAVFAEPPDDEHARLADALGLEHVPGASDYSDVFLFQVYPYASVHVGPEGMMGGEARERVAGFWTALGYTPPAEPDHLAALLGLLATLGAAEVALEGAERRLAAQSQRTRHPRRPCRYICAWPLRFPTRDGKAAMRSSRGC